MSERLDMLAALVLEDGSRWGDRAAPFQWRLADAYFADDGPRFHWEGRPRGGSKTSDAGGLLAVDLLTLPPLARSYLFATDRDQAALTLDAIRGWKERSPVLAGRLEVGVGRVTCTSTGATLDVMSADGASAYGLLGHRFVVDEIGEWPDTSNMRKLWLAITTGLGKIDGCRALVVGTAGEPASWQHQAYQFAESSPLWSVHDVHEVPWTDAAYLESERQRLLESSFQRLYRNLWVSSEDSLATLDQVRACATLVGPVDPAEGKRYVIAVDLGVKHDSTVVAVMHSERQAHVGLADDAEAEADRLLAEAARYQLPLGFVMGEKVVDPVTGLWSRQPVRWEPDLDVTATKVVVDRLQLWKPTRTGHVALAEVEELIAEVSRSYNHAEVVADPWQALGMLQRLQTRGVRSHEFTLSQVTNNRLALVLYQLLRNEMIALPDDADLVTELSTVRLKSTGRGQVKVDHDANRHDDQAVAIGIGATHLLSQPANSGQARVIDNPFTSRSAPDRMTLEEQRFSRRGETWVDVQRRAVRASGLVGNGRVGV